MAAGSSPIATLPKDPTAVLDYTLDFKDYLKGDALSSVTWTVPAGITDSGNANSASTATIWLAGGTAGTSYSVYAVIVTTGGRTDKRTIKINVIER